MATCAKVPLSSAESNASSSHVMPATTVRDAGKSQPILDDRTKLWAPRVRTGCLTCRKRHVKCDETKPLCLKCIAGHRECTYLRSPPTESAVRRSLYPAPVIGTAHEPSLSRYFIGTVIVFLADEFNGDFWRHSLPQVMHNVEAIWHGSNAIASLSLSHRAVGSAMESTRQYSLSTRHILEITQVPVMTPKNKAIVLLANVLYGVYALFTGDTVANIVLHEKTRRLIRHWKFWECTESAPISTLSMQLLHHFLKSSTLRQEALFISPEHPRQIWLDTIAWFQKRPMVSITQAYVEFEMIWISLRATLDNLPFRPTKKDIMTAAASRTVLRGHFESWHRRYRALNMATPPISLHASIFKVRSILASIMLKLDLQAAKHLWDETIWDACNPEFTRAFHALEAALEKESKETRRAEFDTQFTPSLYKALTFIARACRHPVLRRDAIALLRRSLGVAIARLSRVTGNIIMEFIADQVIDVEEIAWREDSAMIDCGEGSKCVKDSFVCNMHRIARVLAPSEILGRLVDYTLLTTGDILHGREGHKESVRAVFFS